MNLKTGKIDVLQQLTANNELTLPKNNRKRMGIALFPEALEALTARKGSLATIGNVPVFSISRSTCKTGPEDKLTYADADARIKFLSEALRQVKTAGLDLATATDIRTRKAV